MLIKIELLISILMLCLIFSNCSKENIEDKPQDTDTVFFELSTNEIEIDNIGGCIEIKVHTTLPYNIVIHENSKEWIHLESTQTVETESLTDKCIFSINKSNEYSDREGIIIFRGENLSDTVKICQLGKGILSLDKKEYIVSSEGEKIFVDLQSNFEFDIKMPPVDWITPISSKGISTHTLCYLIASNDSYYDREAKIIYYDKNNKDCTDTLCIVQRSKDIPIIKLNSPGSLKDELSKLDIDYLKVRKLILEGMINGSDIRVIREMAGRDYIEKETNGILEYLDLSNVNIVEGGDAYCYPESDRFEESCHSQNNIIGDCMFRSCNSLKEILLPISCTEIKEAAFEFCENLTTVKLYDNVKNIGEWCFYSCVSLKNIVLPSSITLIGEGAFELCMSLEYMKIPEGIITLNRSIFFNCPALKEVILPQSLEVIDRDVFCYCSSLTSINIPDRVIKIGSSAFGECISMAKIYLGSGLKEANCFDYKSCINIREIHIKAVTPPDCSFADFFTIMQLYTYLKDAMRFIIRLDTGEILKIFLKNKLNYDNQ